ncbi:MAG: spondin domain-containing protein [Marinifilaceae bacterium]|jgi:hypothetical protein|nr:spondin domain-containing protein [Marinifilaceae bacterium]
MKNYYLIYVFLLLFVFACSDDDDDNKINKSDKIAYEIVFKGKWTAVTHPTDYPSNAHFSPIVCLSHSENVSLFKEGTKASEGIESMAETGATSILDSELSSLINDKTACYLEVGKGLPTGTSETSITVYVDSDNPYISLVSMIAPSPDWFVGIDALSLIKDGEFIDKITVDAEIYDSGTDSGITFTSTDSDTQPAENIYFIKDAPLGDGEKVSPALAEFIITRK